MIKLSAENILNSLVVINIAFADAASTWYYKYLYNFWRPVTAIRNAATDGNPNTIDDVEYTILVFLI